MLARRRVVQRLGKRTRNVVAGVSRARAPTSLGAYARTPASPALAAASLGLTAYPAVQAQADATPPRCTGRHPGAESRSSWRGPRRRRADCGAVTWRGAAARHTSPTTCPTRTDKGTIELVTTMSMGSRDGLPEGGGLTPSRPAPVPPAFPTHMSPGAPYDAMPRSPAPMVPKFPQAGPGVNAASIVRKGYVSVKEDGLRSWIWSKRWLVLRESTLLFHKNDVRGFAHTRPPSRRRPSSCCAM